MEQFLEALSDEITLFVRHSAWLNATPDKPKDDKSEGAEISRRERLKKKGIEHPEMPECDAMHIVGYLFEIGPTHPTGTGELPISHAEIESWQHNTGIDLNAWESRILRRLSIEYLNESHKAKDIDCPPPWEDAPYAVSAKERKAEETKNAMRALATL